MGDAHVSHREAITVRFRIAAFETRSLPNSLALILVALPSVSLFPIAPLQSQLTARCRDVLTLLYLGSSR
jgi:hypothetical protein